MSYKLTGVQGPGPKDVPAEKVNPFDQPQAARLTGPEDAITPSPRKVTFTQLAILGVNTCM
jgi:hypothetical protein